MSDSYRKEIEKGVILLVTESENIRNRIVKNEYIPGQMSREIGCNGVIYYIHYFKSYLCYSHVECN